MPVAYLAGVVSWDVVVVACVAGVVVAGVMEFVRLGVGVSWWVFDRLTREYEQAGVAGYAWYVVGGAVVVVGFEPMIAVPALFMLTIGDPASGLVTSRDDAGPKAWRPVVVMFVVCFAFAVLFVPLGGAVLGAAAATLGDAVKPVVRGYVVDDNLTIPIAGAAGMWVGITLIPV